MWAYPEIRTLGDYPDYWARHDPARIMFKMEGRNVSFAQFDRLANQSAHYLLGQGAKADELIGFMGPHPCRAGGAELAVSRARIGAANFR
jgi:acyl-CoA synthetase (AMP-forming)/AMP-acid ligase II